MSTVKLTCEMVEAAVLGGCVLGGGGGGSMEEGRKMAQLAVNLSSPELIDIENMDDDAILVNVAAVGAPSSKDAYAEPIHYLRALELMNRLADVKICGIITNEAGGLATVNGWLQAAMLGIPVVDAPCNGRAHPTGVMGAMGLHKNKDYKSIQAAVGGSRERGTFTEVVATGSVERVSAIVRAAAVQAGGLVSVARNPVSCRYARDNAAVGAVKQAINLGREMIKAREKGPKAVIRAACDFLKGEVVVTGTVERVYLESAGGFDVGKVVLENGFEIFFWNEYMTLEKTGERLATFPDLIMTLDADTGIPVTSAEIKEGQNIAVLKVEKERLKLGAGMRDPELFKACERAIGKKILEYVF
ncbi:MAG TPA: DUF917 family protein [Thermoanaerobacterales bacterium]|nr:DUF917 family protein [Thermoanaerobacterales bacterium]